MMIQIKDVRFSWPSSPGISQSFGLEVEEFSLKTAGRLFLYGPSGSGKSTFLSMLAGIVKPKEGEILICGHNLTSMASRKRDVFRAEHMGIVFQQFNLIPYLSVLENTLLGVQFCSSSKKEGALSLGKELLSRLGFAADEFSQLAQYLSVGQQQRVAVARALVGSPEVILADEPTSALDAELKQSFMSLLMELCEERGSTLIFVSHDHSLKDLFSHSLALKEIMKPWPVSH